jgi:hypothetical protein
MSAAQMLYTTKRCANKTVLPIQPHTLPIPKSSLFPNISYTSPKYTKEHPPTPLPNSHQTYALAVLTTLLGCTYPVCHAALELPIHIPLPLPPALFFPLPYPPSLSYTGIICAIC